MDRKSWIILFLCSIGLYLTYTSSQENTRIKEELAKREQVVESASAAQVLESQQPEVPAKKEDQSHQLVGKDGDKVDVIYTFTSHGGGVKTAEFPHQKAIYGDGVIKLNEKSLYPVGAIAEGYNKIDSTFYERTAATDTSVTYVGALASGLQVTKVWTLIEGEDAKGYQLTLNVSFKNTSAAAVNLSSYGVYTGTGAPLHGKEMQDKAGWFYYDDGDFTFGKDGKFKGSWFGSEKAVEIVKTSSLEYAGVNNQFFTTFVMPKGFQADTLWATSKQVDIREDDEVLKRSVFTMGVNFPEMLLAAGSEQQYALDIYMGPRQRDIVSHVADHTEEIMNYGWFAVVANFMSWMINIIHGWFGDAKWAWGAAVILLTVFIRIIIWPLHNKSTRTMKRMSKLQPIMKELKEKHKDDPAKLNQETMKLYRTYGVNPMGGCLPMLVQIPIFFGVFKMLGSAVEMRGAEFLWVNDLARPDTVAELFGYPINLLPIIMAVTMVFQMRLTPQSGDKLQRRIFMLMPLMFFFFCYNYAAALALYWSTQNIVSIAQTLLMKKLPEPELQEKGGKAVDDGKPRKKGMFEKLAEKMEEVQKQQDIAAGRKPQSGPANPADMKMAKKPKKRTPKTGG